MKSQTGRTQFHVLSTNVVVFNKAPGESPEHINLF